MFVIVIERMIVRLHRTPIAEDEDAIGIVTVLADAVELLRLCPPTCGVLG